MDQNPPWAGLPAEAPLLRVTEAAKLIGCSKSTYYALAAKGVLPRPIKLGFGFTGVSAVPRSWLNAAVAARAGGAGA